jgi:hypothetical protein
MKILNMSEIKSIANGHFFSKGATNFFKSRYAREGYENEVTGMIFFVTSEQHGTSPRLYTVRRLDRKIGNVCTIGTFQGYKTSKDANYAAKELAAYNGNIKAHEAIL